MTSSRWIVLGGVMAALAVTLGAFAAHGLDRFCLKKYPATETTKMTGLEVPLAWKRLNDFKTGAEYQMYHALGLIAVGVAGTHGRSRWLNVAGWLFIVGIVLFSGSLYGITLTGRTILGMIAPIGGTAFILGWIALAVGACRCSRNSETPAL